MPLNGAGPGTVLVKLAHIDWAGRDITAGHLVQRESFRVVIRVDPSYAAEGVHNRFTGRDAPRL